MIFGTSWVGNNNYQTVGTKELNTSGSPSYNALTYAAGLL